MRWALWKNTGRFCGRVRMKMINMKKKSTVLFSCYYGNAWLRAVDVFCDFLVSL